MRFNRKRQNTKYHIYGTPQNPEAEKNAISNEEYQALRKRQVLQEALIAQARRDAAEDAAANTRPSIDHPTDEPVKSAVAGELAANSVPNREETTPAPKSTSIMLSETTPATIPASAASAIEVSVRRLEVPKKAARRKKTVPEKDLTELERHERKCAICHHPHRETIEEDFLHWHNTFEIAYAFSLGNTRVVYRHAHATGLYQQRLKNVRMAAEHIIDHAETVKPTAGAVLGAIRALSRISEEGRGSDPEPANSRAAARSPKRKLRAVPFAGAWSRIKGKLSRKF